MTVIISVLYPKIFSKKGKKVKKYLETNKGKISIIYHIIIAKNLLNFLFV